MEKINFENLPSTNTPLDADTLNQMQTNIEKSTPAISTSKPSTGEKVWLQNGKNLLDKRNLILGLYSISSGTYTNSTTNSCTKDMIEIDNTKNYVLSLNSNDNATYMYVMFYDANKSYLGYNASTLKNPLVLNTYANYSQAKYIHLRFDKVELTDPMLEQGNSKTTYEEYTANTYTKDGDIYRSFTKTENESFRTSEMKVGTWIDGKPLYRKVVIYTNSETIGAIGQQVSINIPHNINNMKICTGLQAFNSAHYRFPTFSGGSSLNSGTCINAVDPNNIVLRIINDTWRLNDWYFILEYTKTTD